MGAADEQLLLEELQAAITHTEKQRQFLVKQVSSARDLARNIEVEINNLST